MHTRYIHGLAGHRSGEKGKEGFVIIVVVVVVVVDTLIPSLRTSLTPLL